MPGTILDKLYLSSNIILNTTPQYQQFFIFKIEKTEGIKKYKLVITKQSWDVKHSIGNMVNKIVITMDGARWVL